MANNSSSTTNNNNNNGRNAWEGNWETVTRSNKGGQADGMQTDARKRPIQQQQQQQTTRKVNQPSSSSPSLSAQGFSALAADFPILHQSEEEAAKRLPGLLNDYIDKKCESNEHCRKTDFDGTAREALSRISFLQALQAIENFAGSVSARIQKRPAYLMCILRGKEQHWEKSRAAAGLEGGAAKLLGLPAVVLVTLAGLCIESNCLPSDFTPEVCLALHRLSAPLAVKAVHAFNSNKRICAGSRGGILNRPRFFQRLIQNVAEQSGPSSTKARDSQKQQQQKATADESAVSTPRSESSTVSSSFSSSSSVATASPAKQTKSHREDQRPQEEEERQQQQQQQHAHQRSQVNEQFGDNIEDPNAEYRSYDDQNPASDSSFLQDAISGEYGGQDIRREKVDSSSSDFFQSQYSNAAGLPLSSLPSSNAWDSSAANAFGVNGNYNSLRIDANAPRAQGPPGVSPWSPSKQPQQQQQQQQQQQPTSFIGNSEASNNTATLHPSIDNSRNGSSWMSNQLGGLSDAIFMQPAASPVGMVDTSLQDAFEKQVQELSQELENHARNERALQDQVSQLRATCQHLHEENVRIQTKHQNLLSTLRQILDQQK